MRRFTPAAALFVFALAPLFAQTAAPPTVPDWAQPGSATHKQVPPPADFHRPTTTEATAIGIFDGQSDVGSAVVPGSSAFDSGRGQYTLHSAGYNIWYTRDEFRFVWKKIEGDASLAVDGAFPNPEGYGDSKIVLAIRQNLEDDSQEAMLGEHKTGMIHLAWRPEKGAMMKDMQYRFGGTLNGIQAKRIGIEKHGDAVAIFVSLQGEPMHQLGPPLTMHLNPPFYIGIGFCSHLPATVDTGIVTNVSFSNAAGMVDAPAPAAHGESKLRSHIFIYDLRDGLSHSVYSADSIWEAPNWSPGGKYLIANHDGAIYKMVLKADVSAEPEKLEIPSDYRANNDKSLSPDGRSLAFSASPPGGKGSDVFVATANGANVQRRTFASPSYFHGWSPDGTHLAFVAQRNGSGQFDVYSMPVAGGAEKQLTSDPHHDDGPDYSPDGRWIYINSDRSGKEAIWRFPADGAGVNDAHAELVLSDALEDWFPHLSVDGTKMIYIGYPTGTATHNSRTVPIEVKMVPMHDNKVAGSEKLLVKAVGGQGTINVNSWAPDSMRFAYVTYEALP